LGPHVRDEHDVADHPGGEAGGLRGGCTGD
jgi:hypothetical protein